MHMVDRDSSTDRQRQEVKGMRQPAGGSMLTLAKGETWRLAISCSSRLAQGDTTFTHIMQLKMPGDGSSPIV